VRDHVWVVLWDDLLAASPRLISGVLNAADHGRAQRADEATRFARDFWQDGMVPARVRLTARLRLEPIGVEHAEDLWRLFQDPSVAEWYGAWTLEMAQREAARIAKAWEADGVHKWIAYDRSTGALVGRGGLSRAHIAGKDRLEIGWALHREFWGLGYATEIGRAGLAFAFDELAAEEVVSYTECRNARSRAVMERLGFEYAQDIVHNGVGEPFALYVLGRPSVATSKAK
jgi:[ribosomal protein S5]-alanine N-acetyltransferase